MKRTMLMLVICLMFIPIISHACPDAAKGFSTNTCNEVTEISFYDIEMDKNDKSPIIINSEDDLLKRDTLDDKVDTYVILEPGTLRSTYCWECGERGLTTATVYDEYAHTPIPCPMIGWPTGNCQLTHYKVNTGVRCIYCGYQEVNFSFDKVKSTCNEVGGGVHWIIPNKTHADGIDVHECPCSICTNVYHYLPDIINLK